MEIVRKKQNNQGYTLLISVIIIGAVSLSIISSILLLGAGSNFSGIYLEQSYQAKAVVDACAEEALGQIKKNILYQGIDSLIIANGLCNYEVQNTGGQNRQITATSTIGEVVKRVVLMVDQVSPSINVLSWLDE